MNKIARALQTIFEKHRIIFWYDAKKELRGEYEQTDLPGVEKIELQNNEFRVKYRILREEPKQKFLLYHEGPPPPDEQNWLLDVQLAAGEFKTDQSALWLSDMGLGIEFEDIAKDHAGFFKAAGRRESLKKKLKSGDAESVIKTKMLAVCAGSDDRTDAVLESLLAELAEQKDETFDRIKNFGLDAFLWKQLKTAYGYASETPGILDFAIQLFKSCYEMSLNRPAQMNADALIFLKRWKNNIRQQQAFESLSDRCADILNIENDLHRQDISALEEIDTFELIDKKIITLLVTNIVEETLPADERESLLRHRKRSHWYERHLHIYEAVDYGAQFIHILKEADPGVDSFTGGITRYAENGYPVDQLYRKYIFHARKSGQVSLLKPLSEKVENFYTNNYLLPLNNQWQKAVDACDRWGASGIPLQRHFFADNIQPFLAHKKKVFVIISDALRYEAGEELHRMIRREDRFDAEIRPMLSMLPSFTRLGMAALLPNREIKFSGKDAGDVLVDGKSSKGTEKRSSILDSAVKGRAKAMRAEDLIKINNTECRQLIRDHEVIYIYHNRIDAAGDKKESEERVFEAVEETLEELIRMIKKLTNANANNLFVTADHGFIYQNSPLDESDFMGSGEALPDAAICRGRRFLLGKGLPETGRMKSFSAQAAGIEGEMDIRIPKSVSRMRLKGAGSRFVHGGASLQEIVVPVIKINKKRKSDTSRVPVDILGSAASVITTGQCAVAFYQTRPATDKTQPRRLRVGFYSNRGELISDSHDLLFDIASDNPRDREIHVRFVLTQKANEFNGQEAVLRLEEPLPGTSHYKEYKSARYVIRRSFTSDFDL